MTAAITQARQYLANLQTTAGDSKLHEAIAHLSGVLAALDEQKPVGHVVTWNKGGSGEHNSIEPIGKSGYSLAESLPDGALIYLAPPASSNLLTAARHYASSYLQQERDDAKLCCDEQHHTDVCALFAAIEREGEWVERHITPKGPSTGWCTKCGCGNDSAGYAHFPACPIAIAATKEGA